MEKKDNLCIILPQLIEGLLFYNMGEKKLLRNIKNKSEKKENIRGDLIYETGHGTPIYSTPTTGHHWVDRGRNTTSAER